LGKKGDETFPLSGMSEEGIRLPPQKRRDTGRGNICLSPPSSGGKKGRKAWRVNFYNAVTKASMPINPPSIQEGGRGRKSIPLHITARNTDGGKKREGNGNGKDRPLKRRTRGEKGKCSLPLLRRRGIKGRKKKKSFPGESSRSPGEKGKEKIKEGGKKNRQVLSCAYTGGKKKDAYLFSFFRKE